MSLEWMICIVCNWYKSGNKKTAKCTTTYEGLYDVIAAPFWCLFFIASNLEKDTKNGAAVVSGTESQKGCNHCICSTSVFEIPLVPILFLYY